MRKRIAVLIGSLRSGSWTRKVALALIAAAPPSLTLEIIEIDGLPLYNEDLEDNKIAPTQWSAFRKQIAMFDAVIFATPEYNRSVPAALKNALDIGSRPYGHSVWDGKPGAIVSVSPGALAAFGANHHLRQSLVFLNVPTLQMPEAYIGAVAEKFDARGELTDEATREFLTSFMSRFGEWVEQIVGRSHEVRRDAEAQVAA